MEKIANSFLENKNNWEEMELAKSAKFEFDNNHNISKWAKLP